LRRLDGGLTIRSEAAQAESKMGDSTPTLYELHRKDVVKAGSVLKDAFGRDPLWTEFFAGESDRERKLQAFFEVPVLYCLRYGGVYAPSPALEGIAAWMPGERADIGMWGLIRCGAIRPGLRLGLRAGLRLNRIFAGTVRDRRRHMQGSSYLYLLVIGVATAQQGLGFGAALLRALIGLSERRRRTLYLETETEQNVRLYERFGFHTVKQVLLPGIGLPFWEMARSPSGAR
jgi:ribosomal protein S18 acetylase RimI-like enzyme